MYPSPLPTHKDAANSEMRERERERERESRGGRERERTGRVVEIATVYTHAAA